MRDKGLVLRAMSEAHLALALDWAAAEGWNPGLDDARCFYAADPQGFFLGELDGLPVGCVSAVRYGSGFGFLGLYIVKAEFRGCGFGLQLWRAALDRLGDRVIGLDGVVAQQENYLQCDSPRAARPSLRWRADSSARSFFMAPDPPMLCRADAEVLHKKGQPRRARPAATIGCGSPPPHPPKITRRKRRWAMAK
jgi:GNAT superfamily N-acetyltransferase